MFKKFLFAVMMMVSLAALASTPTATIDNSAWEKLSASQRAEIARQVAVTAERSTATALAPENIDQYVNLGERIGKMLGGAAKELGVAVNTFSETSVGKWTMAIAIWKLLGNDIMHLTVGVLILFTGTLALALIFSRRTISEVEYFPERTFGIFRRVKTKSRTRLGDEDVLVLMIGLAVIGAVSIVTVFAG